MVPPLDLFAYMHAYSSHNFPLTCVRRVIAAMCLGKISCVVASYNFTYVFGDPCLGQVKYVQFNYTCSSLAPLPPAGPVITLPPVAPYQANGDHTIQGVAQANCSTSIDNIIYPLFGYIGYTHVWWTPTVTQYYDCNASYSYS